MSLTKVIYRQLWQKAALLDSFLTTKRGLIPRRELARFNQYVPSKIYNKTNEELADLAKDENLFRSSLRHIFKDANQSIDDDHPSPSQSNKTDSAPGTVFRSIREKYSETFGYFRCLSTTTLLARNTAGRCWDEARAMSET